MTRVLLIGATGVLGRPVARRLVTEGFDVRAMVRRPDRAKPLLPAACELVTGDLRDRATVEAAMADVDAVYLNLAGPMSRRPPKDFEPDLDGTRQVIKAAGAVGVKRVLRISAEGADRAADFWWNARHKVEADRALLDSGLDATVFRPTWFMESLPTFMLGPMMMRPLLGRCPLRFIAAHDYGGIVATAIRDDAWIGRMHDVVGPQLVPIGDAIRRFLRALGTWRLPMPVWRLQMRLAGLLLGKPDYLYRLLDMTVRVFSPMDEAAAPPEGAAGMMTIEGYAAYMRETGDRPRK